MKNLIPVKMTRESFKEYGHLISSEHGEAMGFNEEYSYWGKLSQLNMGNTVSTGILYGKKREPLIKVLERHNNTSEVLVALEGDSVVCFAKPSPCDSNSIEGVQAFTVKQGDAFAMHPGTWHWAPVALSDTPSKFLVLFANGTEGEDLEIKALKEEVILSL